MEWLPESINALTKLAKTLDHTTLILILWMVLNTMGIWKLTKSIDHLSYKIGVIIGIDLTEKPIKEYGMEPLIPAYERRKK